MKSKSLIYFIFILLSLIIGLSLHAERIEIPLYVLRKAITCSSVQEKTLEVVFQNKSYLIAFDHIYSTPVINAGLVCQRLIRYLKAAPSPNLIIPISKKYTKFGHDIYVDESGFLEKACLEQGLCKRNILDTFKPKKILRECHGKITLNGLLAKSRPKIPGYQTKIIKDVTIKIHPFHPFINILNEYLQDPILKEIHASTMSIGNQALDDISASTQSYNKKAVINYDAGISLFNSQQGQIAKAITKSPKVHFLPMTSGNNFSQFYHIKFIASPQTNKSMLASMNLASVDRTAYLDLNFFFEDPTIRDEFLSISNNNNRRFCDYSEDYDCLANFYDERSKSHIPLVINRSCPTSNTETTIKRSGYFVNSEDDDLKQFVINFINQAKQEIIVTSYKLTERAIAKALLNKQQEGLKVHAMLAFKSPALGELKSHFYSGEVVKEEYPFPHMKIIIIDRRLMLFGTANFTINALNNTTELIGVTDNQQAIKTALDHVAVFTQSKDLALSKNISNTPKQKNYVAVTSSTQIKPVNLPFTKPLEQKWLSNYREVTKEGEKLLDKCDLRHLIFITKATYLECLKK